ncbi:MAG: hypothetical protein AB1540_08280 [Bdellovibrionota bacterium]
MIRTEPFPSMKRALLLFLAVSSGCSSVSLDKTKPVEKRGSDFWGYSVRQNGERVAIGDIIEEVERAPEGKESVKRVYRYNMATLASGAVALGLIVASIPVSPPTEKYLFFSGLGMLGVELFFAIKAQSAFGDMIDHYNSKFSEPQKSQALHLKPRLLFPSDASLGAGLGLALEL